MSEGRDGNLRVSDTERENALEALGEHFSAGRIDLDEYGDRTAQVTAARTREDVQGLFADLPEPHPHFGTMAAAAPPPAAPPSENAGTAGACGTHQVRHAAAAVIPIAWVAAIVLISIFHIGQLILIPIALSVLCGSACHKRGRGRRASRVHRETRRLGP